MLGFHAERNNQPGSAPDAAAECNIMSGVQGPRIGAEVAVPLAPKGLVVRFICFEGLQDGKEHFALRFEGATLCSDAPLVRIHSECVTGDIFNSARCDCGAQLREAIDRLSEEGGYLIYLRQEGRGIGLNAKLASYVLQDAGLDTFSANTALGFPPDGRSFMPAAQMLVAMGVDRIRLITNNPSKSRQLTEFGIDISEVEPTGVFSNINNIAYLKAKVLIDKHNIVI